MAAKQLVGLENGLELVEEMYLYFGHHVPISLKNLCGTGAFTKLITHLIVNVNVIGTFLRAFAAKSINGS